MRLLFAETDAPDRHLYEKYTVKFYFTEIDFSNMNRIPLRKVWGKQTYSMLLWCDKHLDPNTYAVLSDCSVKGNKRLIEYGFKNEADAVLFKLTWV